MGPADFFRSRFDNMRAHPFQNIASTLFGGLTGTGPVGSGAANAFFGRYNDNKFNNSAQQFQDFTRDQSQLDTNNAMNKPLGNDRLSGNNPFNWDGPTGPNDGTDYTGGGSSDHASQNRQLGEALTGGGGGQNAGGPSYQAYSGPSMSGQQWMDRSGGPGNILGQLLGVAPDQSPTVNSLLDPISMGPGLPGSGQMNPQARRDGFGDPRNSGLYGVSNFMVGGSPVISGSNGFDPNGSYVYNRRGVGG